MKYFTIFRRMSTAKTDDVKSSVSVTGASCEESVSTNCADFSIGSSETRRSGRSKSKSKSSKSSKAKTERTKEKKETVNANIKVAETFMKTINSYSDVEEVLVLFHEPEKGRCKFEDGFAITLKDWVDMLEIVKASFPDAKFDHECFKEIGSNKVNIEGFRFSGSHTGAPFTFAPVFPAIEATGKHVANDEELLELRVKDGKILGMLCISMGLHTGPPGIYEQIKTHEGCVVPPSA